MTISFYHIVFALMAGIAVIVLLTLKYRVHAFFALLIACFVTGVGVGMPSMDIIATSKEGFGTIMKSLGLIIVLGTTLGVALEQSGSTRVMAATLLKITGHRHAAWAMSLTGLVVGLPVFCDSGYIVLSGLVEPMAKRSGNPVATIAVSLATGLLSVHCLLPPHPGASAAAASLGVDFGRVMVFGLVVAIPAMVVGHGWARFAGRKQFIPFPRQSIGQDPVLSGRTIVRAFIPVALPVVLIALKSFVLTHAASANFWLAVLGVLGDPVIALSLGVLLALSAKTKWPPRAISHLLGEAAEKAGSILVIIGAGGAFGAILAATRPGAQLSHLVNLQGLGLLFPFLCTAVLKTAQGSSTVAIITAASIIQPLLIPLGLDGEYGRMLCVLAMGAGSMVFSHANDAYFWVVLKFSGLDMKTMLKFYSLATLWMGLVSLIMVYILSFFLH
jgi:gluconate:H+ symporter, GntP family